MSNKGKTSSEYRKERNATRKSREKERQKKTQNYISEDFSIREGDFDDVKTGKFPSIIENNDKNYKNTINEQEEIIIEEQHKKDFEYEEELNDDYEIQLQILKNIALKKIDT